MTGHTPAIYIYFIPHILILEFLLLPCEHELTNLHVHCSVCQLTTGLKDFVTSLNIPPPPLPH